MKTSKKGFIFVETVMVLMVLAISLVGLYGLFSSVIESSERRKTYDNINDVYKVNIIKNMFIYIPTNSYVIITKSDCSLYMDEDCTNVFEELKIERVLLTRDVKELITLNINIPNTMKEYLETINKSERMLIVQFIRDEKNYYSSLEIR